MNNCEVVQNNSFYYYVIKYLYHKLNQIDKRT